jgi:hypothetical protein
MRATIFEVTAVIPSLCADGRNTVGMWGHERHYHATRESAEAACGRLRAGGYQNCHDTPEYDVAERTRADFPADLFGEQEWRAACREAGVDPRESASVDGQVRAHN